MNTEKRSEIRQEAKRSYHAEIRLVGVPVYEVKLKDLSTKGSCILVKGDSLLINHLKTGQNVRVKYFLEDRNTSGKFFDATIRYIRMVSEGQFKGHYLVGLERLK